MGVGQFLESHSQSCKVDHTRPFPQLLFLIASAHGIF